MINMDLTLIITILLGMIAGIFTGLIPGIHINLISTLLLINLTILRKFFTPLDLCLFIISMSVMHTFIDFIPSICIGVPSADTYLSVLPAHQMILSGEGYKAIFLSSLGSLLGTFFILILAPLFFVFLKNMYKLFIKFIPYLLIVVSLSLILTEENLNKKFWALFTMLIAGSFGLFILNSMISDNPLLLLFTGMFGLSSIFFSIMENGKIEEQNFKINKRFKRSYLKAILCGGISSSLCSISPGMGNAQAATIGSLLYKKIDSENFIMLLSAINTINFILSILTLYIISKARNGAILAVSQIVQNFGFKELFLFIGVAFIVSIIGFFMTLLLGKIILKQIYKINMKIVNYMIFCLIIIIVFAMTNYIGMIILLCSFCLGIFVNSIGIKRVHLMNCLLVPILFNII